MNVQVYPSYHDVTVKLDGELLGVQSLAYTDDGRGTVVGTVTVIVPEDERLSNRTFALSVSVDCTDHVQQDEFTDCVVFQRGFALTTSNDPLYRTLMFKGRSAWRP